ncbi:hypothetical protein PSTT_14468 [Puccinia striiformis]|uniref:Uncharacterized protein n=1 Tax=Puccinia striiformis TaxID=27350 RepID=A0A2S4UM98_9BASI|nr:hypothetical protein PSTT_14468 [Puccinia striiformis]
MSHIIDPVVFERLLNPEYDCHYIATCIQTYFERSGPEYEANQLLTSSHYLISTSQIGIYERVGTAAKFLSSSADVFGLLEVKRLAQSLQTLSESNIAPDRRREIEETICSIEEANNRAQFWLLINWEIRTTL